MMNAHVRRLSRCARCFWYAATGNQETRRHLKPWLASHWSAGTPVADEAPYVTFGAREWLDRNLTPEMHVFEYGSGGSTLYFARRAARVITIEHNQRWSRRLRKRCQDLGLGNCEVIHAPPRAEGGPVPAEAAPSYRSTRPEYSGQLFDDYARAIECYEDSSFDLVCVDGRARVSCIWHALPKIKPGGYLMLDNAERPEYRPGRDLMHGWPCREFTGFGLHSIRHWQTAVWQKPADWRPSPPPGIR